MEYYLPDAKGNCLMSNDHLRLLTKERHFRQTRPRKFMAQRPSVKELLRIYFKK